MSLDLYEYAVLGCEERILRDPNNRRYWEIRQAIEKALTGKVKEYPGMRRIVALGNGRVILAEAKSEFSVQWYI